MAKNPEELYEQKEFERRNYARLTDDQKKIKLLKKQLKNAQDSVQYYEAEVAELEEQLNFTRSVNSQLDNDLEKLILQQDQVNGIIRDVKTGKISDAMFKSDVISVMGWKR